MHAADDETWDTDADMPEDAAPEPAGFETEVEVTCPHCGDTMTIAIDPAGGTAQDYVEDCEVCCRPWHVRLWYDSRGAADVQLLAGE